MMKVVLISFSILPTLQNYMYETYKSMKKEGIDIYTLGSLEINIPFQMEEKNLFLETTDSPMPNIKSLKLMKRQIQKAYEQIEMIKPDIVHFISKHTWNYFLIKKLNREMPGVKIYHTFHDPIGHAGELKRFGVIAYNKVIGKNIDGIITHSKKSRYDTEKHIKPNAPVFLVPLGCTKWREYREKEKLEKQLLIFGRLNNYKGAELIPEIAKTLYERDSEIRIIIAGKAAKDISEQVLMKISEGENVLFRNEFIPEEELDNYFFESDLVLITHTSITQSGVILDAYAHSKPIVAFDIDGIKEYCYTGECVVPAFDIEKYVDYVIELLNNPKEIQNKARSAWEFGYRHYSNEVMTKGFLKIYKKNL